MLCLVSCHAVNMGTLPPKSHMADQVMMDHTLLHLVWHQERGYFVDTMNPEGQTVKSV